MITFKDWTITSSGLLARQHDNLSRRVEVVGDLPTGWSWELLVQVGGAMDIIPLEPMEDGVGHTLTAEQVSIDGYYTVQLRGRNGEIIKHTNTTQAFVSKSLSGTAQWPSIPSEFTELEQRMWELNNHPPTPGKNGFWQIWDPDRDEYVDSDIPFAGSEDGVDYIPAPAFAEVGQTIRVSAVDETGKPTKWEAVDMTGGGGPSGGGEEWVTLLDRVYEKEEKLYPEIEVTDFGSKYSEFELELCFDLVTNTGNGVGVYINGIESYINYTAGYTGRMTVLFTVKNLCGYAIITGRIATGEIKNHGPLNTTSIYARNIFLGDEPITKIGYKIYQGIASAGSKVRVRAKR